jgi:hypothetical protein
MTSIFRNPSIKGRPNARNIFNAPTLFRSGIISTVASEIKKAQQSGILVQLDSTPSTALGRALNVTPVTTKASFDKLTFAQTATLDVIHGSYTHLLATKKYESVKSNYVQYLNIIKTLKTINVVDPVMNVLIRIVENAINGAIDSIAMNSTYISSQIKILELKKYIDEIISNKNVRTSMSTGVVADIKVEKMFKLSPLFSYYIYIYGMPEFGKGFEPDKMALVQEVTNKTATTLLSKIRSPP